MSKYSSLTSLVLAILILWKSSCVGMPTIIHWPLWNHSPGLDVISDMSWISENQTFVDCPYNVFNLCTHGQNICFWYPLLEIIIPLNLCVELFRCSYHLMPLLNFFPWLSTDTHIRSLAAHGILRWINIWLALHILKPLSSPLDTNWICRVISSTLTSVLYF